jgi:GH15 family glucan-1,4-alpha-glucosidase
MGLSEGVRARLTAHDGSDPRYWPIASYGVIGDCRTAALIAPNGSIDWLCLPHFDSPASLLRLLDHDRGGYFQVRPTDACGSVMRYLPGTNMLETTFTTASGVLGMIDFMPVRHRPAHTHTLSALANMPDSQQNGERAELEREIGNDVAAAHRINRLLTCHSGSVTARVTLKLTPDYARQSVRLHARPASEDSLVLVSDEAQGYLTFIIQRISPPGAANPGKLEVKNDGADGLVEATVPLTEGLRLVVALSYARNKDEMEERLRTLRGQNFSTDMHETQHYWTTWASKMTYDGPYRDVAERSALTLKLCAFEPTGAIIAAPTTSLPEGIGGERNWDYRYSWLRDSSFTLQALARLGYAGEARDYFHFLDDLHLRNGADIRVLYSVRGQTDGDLREIELKHLEGYKGSRPVRIGNGAATQRQMDIYGELADSALRYANAEGFTPTQPGHRLPRDVRRLMTQIADFICDHWQDLDRSIWEERGAERAFVYSRAMCWVALDRAIALISRSTSDGQLKRWRATAQTIREEVESKGYNPKLGSFTQAYGMEAMDAANLRLPLVGFLPVDDPRIQNTVSATGRALEERGPLLYRYLTAESQDGGKPAAQSDDGLSGGEGAFLACAFWYVSCLCLMGRIAEARKRLDKLLAYASPLGLYSEEIDPHSGALLGNFPQAFTHLALVNALAWLSEAERSGGKPQQEPAEKRSGGKPKEPQPEPSQRASHPATNPKSDK